MIYETIATTYGISLSLAETSSTYDDQDYYVRDI